MGGSPELAWKAAGGALGQNSTWTPKFLVSDGPADLQPLPVETKAHFQSQFLDPELKEKLPSSAAEGQGHHDTSQMLSGCLILKDLSARDVSELTGTRTLGSSGAVRCHQDLFQLYLFTAGLCAYP
jgi:hypothetical protein